MNRYRLTSGTLALVSLLSVACSSRVDLAGERQRSTAEDGSTSQGTGGAAGAPVPVDAAVAVTRSDYQCPSSCTTRWFRAKPVAMAPGTEASYCSGFHMSLAGPVQMTAFTPVIDNVTMLHHFEFDLMDTVQVNGNYALCPVEDVNAHPIYEWAPGMGPETLPEGAGITVTTGDFQLNVHYANWTDTTIPGDTSGVGVCICPG